MNWEAIGAIGEIIGALGVIITLLYLASQLRQNTRALGVTSIDSTTQVGNEIRSLMASDPVVTELYYRGLRDPDSLDEIERERLRLILTNALWALWNAWAQSQLGGRESWTAQKHILTRMLGLPGGRAFWETSRGEFDPGFAAEVDRLIGDDGPG
ncbi:MAG: hypothetical protein NXI30_10400 [bacterium]|nr:hypothetical protein [bacterium]